MVNHVSLHNPLLFIIIILSFVLIFFFRRRRFFNLDVRLRESEKQTKEDPIFVIM